MTEQNQEYLAYDVASGGTAKKLRTAVQRAINGGWLPQGGVAVCEEIPGRAFFSQALVKYFTQPIEVTQEAGFHE